MEHYGTEQGFQEYTDGTGATVPAGDVAKALVRATVYIDGRYGTYFTGSRTGGYAQELAWPRTGAVTRDGFSVPSDEVPVAVERAAYEAALRELSSPGSLTPDFVQSAQVKQEQVGDLSVTYADAKGSDESRPQVTIIDELLKPFLLSRKLPNVMVV